MPGWFVRGDFQPTLEAALVGWVRERKRRDALAPLLVVATSRLLCLHLRRRLVERGVPHLAVRFVALQDLADELARPALAAEGSEELPALAAEVLAESLVAGIAADSYFAGVKEHGGFAGVLAATLRDLRDARMRPDDLRRALPGNRKVDDVAGLLAKWEARLAEIGRVDAAGVMERAAARVAADAAALGTRDVAIYGFYDVTRSQRAVLDAVIAASDCAVMVPAPGGPVAAFARPFVDALSAAGLAEREIEGGADARPPQLAALCASLFDDGVPPPRSEPGAVTIALAPTAGTEPREAVARVLAGLASGIPAHRIGVLHRRGEAMEAVQRRFDAFTRANELDAPIPLFRQGGRPFAASAEGRRFLAWLRALGSGLVRESVFEWLYLSAASGDAARLEKVARSAGCRGGRPVEEWHQRLARLQRSREWMLEKTDLDDDESTPAEVDRLRGDVEATKRLRVLVDRLAAARDAIANCKTFVDAATCAVERYAEMHAGAAIDDLTEALRPLADLDPLRLPLALDAFVDLAGRALAEARERPEDKVGFERGVFLGSVLGARGLDFDLLVLLDLREGTFPRAIRQDPILLDVEHDAAGLPPKRRGHAEERFLFRMAVAQARRRLVLSVARFEDGAEKEIAPSGAVLACAEILAGARIDAAALPLARDAGVELAGAADPLERADASRPPIDLREWDRTRVRAAIDRRDSAGLQFLARVHAPLAGAFAGETRRWRDKRFTRFDGMLGAAIAKLHPCGTEKRPLSPSRLEDYASCPFRYFARAVLGLAKDVEPEPLAGIDPRVHGRLIHGVLRAFAEAERDAGHWPPRADDLAAARERLLALARAAMRELESTGAIGHPLAWLGDRARIERDLDVYLAAEIAAGGGGRPELLERAFGEAAPFGLDVGGRKLFLRGAIDRADVGADGRASVLDYKTGTMPAHTKHDPASLGGGARLQLVLYALAAAQLLGREVGAARYLYLSSRKGPTRVANRYLGAAESLWTDGKELKAVLAELLRGIEAGAFFADPRDEKQCDYCDYRAACGKGAGLEARFERKRGDAAAAPYFALGRVPPEADEDDA